MNGDKKKDAETINSIQKSVQEVYFQLEDFKDRDTGGSAQSKAIELMDAIARIRTRVLRGEEPPALDLQEPSKIKKT